MAAIRESLIVRLARVAPPTACVLAFSLFGADASAQTRVILHRTPAEYPALAQKMRISGTVTVIATVEANGNVASARAVNGHSMLRPAAEKAVLQWKFASAPKPAETNIDIQFQLHDEGTR